MNSNPPIASVKCAAPLWLLGDIAPWGRHCRCEFDCGAGLANLEGPLLSDLSIAPRPKAGPSLRHHELPPFAASRVVSLANNHMMDYGAEALVATCATLREAGVAALGAGAGLTEARAPVFLDVGGVRVAVLACCERQFGGATATSSGVAVLGPWMFEAVRAARRSAEAVIVSIHAGVETLPWPEAWRREWCHALVEAGADVVHGHHSHVPQAYEVHAGALITYGLGNFVVDPARWQGQPNAIWSAAFEVTSLLRPVQFKVHTLVCEGAKGDVVVRSSAGEEADRCQSYLGECNRVLADDALLEGVRQEAAVALYERSYAPWMKWATQSGFQVRPLAARERWVRPLRSLKESLFGKSREWHSKVEDYLLRYHLIACESHREMLATALGVLGGTVTDLRSCQARDALDRLTMVSHRESDCLRFPNKVLEP